MSRRECAILLVPAALCLLALRSTHRTTPEQQASTQRPVVGDLLARCAQLPLSFEANGGQVDESVRFLSRGSGYGLFLTPTEAVLSLAAGTEDPTHEPWPEHRSAVLRMQLVGAHPEPRMEGLEELPGKVNYFIGNDPEKWRTNVPTYGKVRSCDVYPGVDLVYYGNRGELEYDLVVSPGADPDLITLGFEGAESLAIDGGGDLVLQANGREIRQRKPVIYQETGGARRAVRGGYVLRGEGQVGFHVGAYDADRPLVIDPVLSYATYLGGSEFDDCPDIAVDADGNAYVTGDTHSTDFPGTAGSPLQPAHGGGYGDAYVTKVNANGTALVYSTYLGGSDHERGIRIAVDASGNAYVTGDTASTDFPGTVGSPIQDTLNGERDAFVTKLNASGSALAYSTYLGGSEGEEGLGIAVDASGNACVTGDTSSDDFTGTAGSPIQDTYGGEGDAFVTKVNASGTALVYSTYLGGSESDIGIRIAVDQGGNAYVTGNTDSTDFPGTAGSPIQDTLKGGADTFVTKVNADGTALVYSTYLGGSSHSDGAGGIAVDAAGNAYVTGGTRSTNFPGTSGSPIQDALDGDSDAYVTKVNANGTALVYSTYLGGSDGDSGGGIAVDAAGNAYVTGNTDSADFPGTTGSPIQADYGGGGGFLGGDAFVTMVNASGSALVYSTYLGGSTSDRGYGIAVDTAGNAYVGGHTDSTDFPGTAESSIQDTYGGSYLDGFVAKIGAGDLDGDGLLDLWETPASEGGGYTHGNGQFVDLYALGARKDHKDIFVQIDYMAGRRPIDSALAKIVTAFANAPVDNPDGVPGITLHVNVDEQLAFVDVLGTQDGGGNYVWTDFDDLKADHFAEELGWAVHYCIWANKIPGQGSGVSRGSDFIVSLGDWIEASGQSESQESWDAGTFMHELGHNLGLRHGGGDDVNFKPNYLSVMNWSFQMDGLMQGGVLGNFDYSRSELSALDENNLNESQGLTPAGEVAGYGTTWWWQTDVGGNLVQEQQWTTDAAGPIDWRVTNDPDNGGTAAGDINTPPNRTAVYPEVLSGHDDWSNLVYTGGNVGGGIPLPPPATTPAEELDLETTQTLAFPVPVTKVRGHVAKRKLHLTWKPAGPRTMVREYRIRRDGVQIGKSKTTQFKDTDVEAGTSYTYVVIWVNRLGQESVPSEEVTLKLK